MQSITDEPESRKKWMLQLFKIAAQQHVRNNGYQFWTHENHAVYIDIGIKNMLNSKLNYIHNNPVKEGIIDIAENYLYSSAKDYTGLKGLIDMALLL